MNKSYVKLKKQIQIVDEILREQYGTPNWRRKDPLDELMITILSQNTNDNNRDMAYRSLRAKFPEWEQVMNAPQAEVQEAVKSAGLSGQKSRSIQNALTWIKETFGKLDLTDLRELSDDEVISMLTSQKGIGIKTAAVMLAFSMDRDLCPVDTHVDRIAKRLGWAEHKLSAEKIFDLLKPNVPKGKAASFHLNLLKFGRTICTARNPSCGSCFIKDHCGWELKHKFTLEQQ